MKKIALTIALVFGLGLAPKVYADIVFPARLELVEVEPGIFQVTFQLPVLNGRYPSADALLPDACTPMGEEVKSYTNSAYTRSWMIRCSAEDLYGQVIQIRGLLGTNVDVVLQINLLNSRQYATLLRPGKSSYLIPEPPTYFQLFNLALPKGMKALFGQREFWLLLLLFAFSCPGAKLAIRTLVLFIGGYMLSAWLGGQQWLEMWAGWAVVAAMAGGVILSLRLLSGARWHRLEPGVLYPATALIGLYYGSGYDPGLDIDGLAFGELQAGYLFQMAGMGLALVVMYALGRSLRQGLLQSAFLPPFHAWRGTLGYAGGILCSAFLFYWLSSPILLPSLRPDWPPSLYLALFAVGFTLAFGVPRKELLAGIGLACLTAGLIIGAKTGEPTGTGLFLSFSVFAIGALALIRLPGVTWPALVFAGSALLAAGFETGSYIQDNLSFPVARMMAALMLGSGVIFFLGMILDPVFRKWPASSRLAGGALAIWAMGYRLDSYGNGWQENYLDPLASGQLPLPVLACACLALAALVWPRRHRVARQLGVHARKGYAHWVFLSLAFFLLPFGNIRVQNPIFSGTAPDGERARRKLEESLRQTYMAFNIQDDEALYDELSKSVSENLIADIYLDSRRRLSEGVREGAEVSVRSVEVLELGEGSSLHAYPCTWAVTARVRHLQHVHHRRNVYTGTIEINPESQIWKIEKVALQREERSIVPAPNG